MGKKGLCCSRHDLFALVNPVICPLERLWQPMSGGEVLGSPGVE